MTRMARPGAVSEARDTHRESRAAALRQVSDCAALRNPQEPSDTCQCLHSPRGWLPEVFQPQRQRSVRPVSRVQERGRTEFGPEHADEVVTKHDEFSPPPPGMTRLRRCRPVDVRAGAEPQQLQDSDLSATRTRQTPTVAPSGRGRSGSTLATWSEPKTASASSRRTIPTTADSLTDTTPNLPCRVDRWPFGAERPSTLTRSQNANRNSRCVWDVAAVFRSGGYLIVLATDSAGTEVAGQRRRRPVLAPWRASELRPVRPSSKARGRRRP